MIEIHDSKANPEGGSEKRTLGKTLINIGAAIEKLSEHEVENKDTIKALGVIGVAGLALVAGHAINSQHSFKVAEGFGQLADRANSVAVGFKELKDYQDAADSFGLSAYLYGRSADFYEAAASGSFKSATLSAVIASDLATLSGIEAVKVALRKDGLYIINGKTKVSTSAGPALAKIFKAAGEFFEKKTS